VEAKRAQDDATAGFLKICLNSQYGNLNSHTSEIFDPALALTVTINGQLALLMLAEMLYLAGFEILSINTDGVTTIVDEREDDAKAVYAQWEQRIGLQLEYANYSDYIARDVNNYCARYRNGGLKRKGWFGKGAGTTPSVLADGVIAYFLNGTSAEEFISAQDNLFDFLYAGRAQLKHVFWKNVPLQKNNRWYKSVDGQPIVSFRTLEEAASEKKGHKISGSDSAVPVNRIEDPSVPADLDREHYIDEIVKVCNRIKERHVSKEAGGGSLLDKAKKFAELGFHIVPKGTPQNPNPA
jgi:DNA polymerase elongation subunit (family B)